MIFGRPGDLIGVAINVHWFAALVYQLHAILAVLDKALLDQRNFEYSRGDHVAKGF